MAGRAGRGRAGFRAWSWGMAAAFAAFAALQYNDPDPEVWAAAYLLPAWLSLLAALGRRPGRRALGTAVAYLAWAAVWPASAHDDPAMAYEVGKEVGGLLIAAGWMAVLGWRRS